MRFSRCRSAYLVVQLSAVAILISLPATTAPQSQPEPVPQSDTCTLDADGTAHVTRIVPLPGTISPEARKFLTRPAGLGLNPTVAEVRARMDAFRKGRVKEARKLYPVNVEEKTFGGVRCDLITPLAIPAENQHRVLINVHGGGFNSDSGSLVEGIPIANLCQTKVVSVYYRLAPEHPFPAAVDDTVAVYKDLLKTHEPKNVGLFGTSAGAILTAEVAARLKHDGLSLPGVLGVFSGTGDLSQAGDSAAIFTSWGLNGPLVPPTKEHSLSQYVGNTDPKDPVLSPIYADLQGFPPTLFVTSTRDQLLSGTALLHRAFLRAGVEGELVVFEALPHAFWYDYELPESKEALSMMADFFDRKLGK